MCITSLIDCPDLLLETKRHVREGDLRSVVSQHILVHVSLATFYQTVCVFV